MSPEKVDSLADDVKPLVLELLRQISGLTARVNELVAQNKALLVRIAELEAEHVKPPKTPDNSSLPPSCGQKGNVAEPTRVKKSRKGRPGAARTLAENPDATRDIYAERCVCGAALAEADQELARAWDHVDLPPIKPITTRINLFRATCPCCKTRVTAQAPADMPEGSPFGPGIKAVVAYVHGCQMVGFKRLTELCEGLFGLTISQGAISNMLARMGKPFGAAAEQIAATVRASEVIASDETSARVKGKTHWQWAFGCATAVYHVIAPTRSKCVPTDFLAGVRPKVWLSDRLPAQCTHAEAHQFCLAHLIRDAQYATEADPAKIRTAVTASYRFNDPLIGTFSRHSLHEYLHLLQDRLLCSGPIGRLDVAFFLRGPMDELPPSIALRFSREAPRVGLTGICEIELAEGGVDSETVEYDLNLASNPLRSAYLTDG